MLNLQRMFPVPSCKFFSHLALALVASCMMLLCACEEKAEPPVDYNKIYYKNYRALNIRIDDYPIFDNIEALEKKIEYRYSTMVGDTLDVLVLEFKSDVYALDYYMNSGRFQGIVPILRGPVLEQSIRSGARIFIFRHDSFRRYERSDLESYVRGFPGGRGGFPQEFLSLPFEHREAGHTSIQTKFFLGVKSYFPILAQSYRDGNLQWNVARSWALVEESDYESWAKQLQVVEPQGIAKDVEVTYFSAGDGVNGMSKRLPGGRIVIVWGYLSWFDLERNFFAASDRIYEARY